MKYLFYPVIAVLFVTVSFDSLANSRWYFRDDFSAQDQTKLKHWVSDTKLGVERLIAPFPFDTHFVFHRRHLQREPVPWANTQRDYVQGVHFYVDTRYAASRFRQDWTASHEISHLLIPWLGDKHKWFAEGFASYLQYQVMHNNGDISWQEVIRRYAVNFAAGAKHNATKQQSIAQVSQRMHSARANKVVYWGGALYFLKVDRQLYQLKGLRLFDVLAQYQACCRKDADWGDSGFNKLIGDLDRLSATKLFSLNLPRFQRQKGFPNYQQDLDWLSQQNPK